MPPRNAGRLFNLRELLQCVGTSRLEQSIARAACSRIRDDERARNELRQEVDYGVVVYPIVGGHRGCRVEREAAGKDCQTTQHHPLVLAQQVVAPVQCRAQRLLPWQCSMRVAGQHPKAIAEPRIDLLDRQRASTGCGKFQRERNAVEMNANLGNCRCSSRSQLEIGQLLAHPRDQQLHGLGALQIADARTRVG